MLDVLYALPDAAIAALFGLAMFLAVADLMSDPTKPASEKDFKVTRDHLRELTRIAEREINAILLSCKQARRRAAPWWGAKETLH